VGVYDGLMPQQRAALGGHFAGAQGIGGLSGLGQQQQQQLNNPFYKHLEAVEKIVNPKPKTLIEELQAETDEWIGDL
jgi:hypothetical protein